MMLGEGGESRFDTNINFLLEEYGIMVNNGNYYYFHLGLIVQWKKPWAGRVNGPAFGPHHKSEPSGPTLLPFIKCEGLEQSSRFL